MNITNQLREAILNYKNGEEEAFLVIREESEDYVSKCVRSVLKEQADDEELVLNVIDEMYLEMKESICNLSNVDSFFGWVSFVVNQKLSVANGNEDIIEEVAEDNIEERYGDGFILDSSKTKPKMKKSTRNIILVVAAVLVVAIVLVVSAFMEKKGKVNNDDVVYGVVDVFEQTIPEGCRYYSTSEKVWIEAGETFPAKTSYNDNYITDEYTYILNYIPTKQTNWSYEWSVVVNSKTKTTYGEILSEVRGIPVSCMDSTFSGCEELEKAPIIPNGVTHMEKTFSGCSSLKKMPNIPSGVTSMNGTFENCTSMQEISEIPNGVTSMNGTFENCTSLQEISEIPSGVVHMEKTFSGCSSLKKMPNIPNGVTSMNGTFENCTSLQEISEIPNGVTHMEKTFSGCTSLKTAPVIPKSVENIDYLFKDCSSLQGEIIINCQHQNCRDVLTGVNYNNITLISPMRDNCINFSSCEYEITIPEGCKYVSEEGTLVAGDKFPAEDSFRMGNQYYTEDYVYTYVVVPRYGWMYGYWHVKVRDKTKESYTDVLYKMPLTIDESDLYMAETFAGCTNLKEAPSIPAGVYCLDYTFLDCINLEIAPEMPLNVETMNGTFSGCTSLKQAPVIPEGVCYINELFRDCTSLTGTVEIESEYILSYKNCFYGIDFDAQNIKLTGASQYLEEIKNTANEVEDESNTVQYGDTIRISVKRFCMPEDENGNVTKYGELVWKEMGEMEVPVTILGSYHFEGKVPQHFWWSVSNVLGREVNDTYFATGYQCYKDEYGELYDLNVNIECTILEINKK